MTGTSLVWGSPDWRIAAAVLFGAGLAALVWGYWRAPSSSGCKLAAGSLKVIGLAALALCLVEPLWSGTRARHGANLFAIVADNSQSLTIRDGGSADSRGEELQKLLLADSAWQSRLGEEFDARRFLFDTHLRAVDDFSELAASGPRTSLHAALNSIARRFCGLPLAGVLLLTDGNTTDEGDIAWDELPPIYPVAIGSDAAQRDVRVTRMTISQTNFEAAPVEVRADVAAFGYAGSAIVAKLLDESGQEVQSQTADSPSGDTLVSFRFQVRPDEQGVSFYRVRAYAEGEQGQFDPADPAEVVEATLANNERVAVVDRGGGPYRILYVCGRPNWEFKFLHRALDEDGQLDLVGLIRIARREPKFTFRSRTTGSANPLFSGFDVPDEESTERYDQPVLLRIGTEDEHELREGFPKTAEDLYRYDAIVLDDVEAEFFSPDQLALLQNFVGRRGGGFLMLGGVDSFAGGKYDRTPVASLLPVYVEPGDAGRAEGRFRLALTREGWLQPWVRLRKTEPEERQRLAAMMPFYSLSPIGQIKPAATVLAHVVDETGREHPALVAQRFGAGRSAALLLGDMWRWGMRRPANEESDLECSWRQTARWLVADVPQRVEIDVRPQSDSPTGAVTVEVRARDADYLPLDNAQMKIRITTPAGQSVTLDTEPSNQQPGVYLAHHVPREPGPYRAQVSVAAPDGSPVGERETGWVAQPIEDEFQSLAPNQALLAQLADRTGGEVVPANELDRFVRTLSGRDVPITEPAIRPMWHHPLFYLAVILCITAEWGLRRWKGLA